MRKFLFFLSITAAAAQTVNAQTVATFDDLSLPKPDTFYVNWATPMSDVGFNDGLAHFPCYYDTSWGGYWSSGFAYSNMTDSVTSGFTNEYSAKTAIGYSGTANYAVAYCSPSTTTGINTVTVNLTGAAVGMTVSGFYVTNNTYAYNSMKSGDAIGKKFGGTSGNDPDWFKLTVKGMHSGSLTADSVDYYLADYRFADNDSDYIVKTWQWVDLASLGHVDSLVFMLRSSDTGSFGMNTPAYFCIDNFTTNETGVEVTTVNHAPAVSVYPDPALNSVTLNFGYGAARNILFLNSAGTVVKTINTGSAQTLVNISDLSTGNYQIVISGAGQQSVVKFVKQ